MNEPYVLWIGWDPYPDTLLYDFKITQDYAGTQVIYSEILAANQPYTTWNFKEYHQFYPQFILHVTAHLPDSKMYVYPSLYIYESRNPEQVRTSIWKQHYYYGKEIIRREQVRMNYVGNTAKLLKRLWFGQKNTANLDPITGIPLDNVVEDGGTGILESYHPVATFIYSNDVNSQRILKTGQPDGLLQEEQLQIRKAGHPLVFPLDIVFTPDNGSFYRVMETQDIQMFHTNIILIQVIRLARIENRDPIYQLICNLA